ncbi:protein kinase domain-containing protein [Nocardiopsis lucentensis]|uniref:protein kinase domain-containing protein n=1 Tax=Nocardiopsis lucentensis TaxID=53441 RepID=UPI00034A2E13|nr:protein kinase [Nocardiopsis lucentensis]
MAMSAGFPTGEELPERIGHYVIRRRIGQGGMGVVYQAEDPRTEQFVAVKVLKPEVAGDHIARARLAREVETMRRVQSPNVAEVIDADTQAELPWVVTEYIPGPTLDATVTDHGPLRGRALTRFVTGLARAIKDIHAVDVIHRDLKPGNVIISNGEPIVIDFGIAHAVDGAKLTQTGTFVGTPSYLSPEVIEGTDLGPATDVHAWGGTVAFACTGRPPYGAGSFEVIFFRILNGEIDMDGTHEALRPLVTAAVSRDMARRPSAAELVERAGQLNLDLPWTEDTGTGSTGLTGNHTVYNAPVDDPGDSDGAAGAAGAAAGGAAGYLAHRAAQGDGGWSPSHTAGGPTQPPTASSWTEPVEPGRGGDADDRHRDGEDATDDLSGLASAGRESHEEAAHASGGVQGTQRLDPFGSEGAADPEGTRRIRPDERPDHGDAQGTQMLDPVAGDPQGTMMMPPQDQRPVEHRTTTYEAPGNDAPQTQFFNTPLSKGDFGDILTPVERDGRSHRQTQEFDEDDYGGDYEEGRGGLLGRFRSGRSDRLGDYFRGGADEYDDEYEDDYEHPGWRMHPLTLIPLMVALAGVALWFPWFGFGLGVVVISVLSALDVVKAEHARRLQTRGPRDSDTMVVALSFPWALGRMLVRTLGFCLIYLIGGILVGLVYAQFVETGGEGANWTGAFAVFVMVLLGYIMPSGRSTRHQAVWLAQRARFTNLYLYIGVVVAIVLLMMLILSIGLTAAPDWTPFGGPSDWFSGN